MAVGLCVAMSSLAVTSVQAGEPVRIAVLSAELQNDRAEWGPATGYIASVDAGQLSFVKSVSLRGNTDES